MSESTTTNPTLVKDQVSSLLVQPLEAASIVLASGPRIFDSSEPLKIPRLVSSTVPGYVAEGAQIPDTHDVGFDERPWCMADRRDGFAGIEEALGECDRRCVCPQEIRIRDAAR